MKSLKLLIAAALVFALGACSNLWQGNEATLTLYLGGSSSGSRAVADYPPSGEIFPHLNFDIELTGPSDDMTVHVHGESHVSLKVNPGHWNIAIKAYLGSELYAEGSGSADILPGQDNPVAVKMRWSGAELILSMETLPANDENLARLNHHITVGSELAGTERTIEKEGAGPFAIPVISGDLYVRIESFLNGIFYAESSLNVVVEAAEKMPLAVSLNRIYTVTFDANNGSPVPDSQQVSHGGGIFKPDDPAQDNRTFIGWYKDNGIFQQIWDFERGAVTENITLYAKWNINEYIVTFNSNEGSAVSSQSRPYNTVASKPGDPVRTGYDFVGWYKDNGTFGQPWNFEKDVVTGNITLFARWIKQTQGTANITINLWANEMSEQIEVVDFDGDFVISADDSALPSSLEFEFTGSFDEIKWFILTSEITEYRNQGSITISAEDYNSGTYQLSIMAIVEGVPYSAEIAFSVE